MNAAQAAPAEPSEDAALVAALFAVDPAGLGGVALRASADQGRDQWLALVKALPALWFSCQSSTRQNGKTLLCGNRSNSSWQGF